MIILRHKDCAPMPRPCRFAQTANKPPLGAYNPRIKERKLLRMTDPIFKDQFHDFDHTFILRPLRRSCYYDYITAEFFPVKESSTSRRKKTHAVFNTDQRHFTPAFVVGKDLDEYEETPEFDRDRFKEKIKALTLDCRSNAGKGEILIPKPTNQFCQVCRKEYEDYVDHCEEEIHKEKIINSKANKDIKSLCFKYLNLQRNKKIMSRRKDDSERSNRVRKIHKMQSSMFRRTTIRGKTQSNSGSTQSELLS